MRFERRTRALGRVRPAFKRAPGQGSPKAARAARLPLSLTSLVRERRQNPTTVSYVLNESVLLIRHFEFYSFSATCVLQQRSVERVPG